MCAVRVLRSIVSCVFEATFIPDSRCSFCDKKIYKVKANIKNNDITLSLVLLHLPLRFLLSFFLSSLLLFSCSSFSFPLFFKKTFLSSSRCSRLTLHKLSRAITLTRLMCVRWDGRLMGYGALLAVELHRYPSANSSIFLTTTSHFTHYVLRKIKSLAEGYAQAGRRGWG